MSKTSRGDSRVPRLGKSRSNGSIPAYLYIVIGVVVVGILVAVFWPKNEIHGLNVSENAPVKAEHPKAVNVTLDVSASMEGYSKGADYTDLISHLKGWNPKTTIWLGDTKLDPKKDIITELAGGKINYTGASLLNEDIKRLAKRAAKDSSLELFVTDGILSGSDAQIKSAANWNYLHRLDLMNDVKEALLAQKNLAASVYQLPVKFNGLYYDKENNHGQYNGQRYLYVIALGKASNLASLKQAMSSLKANNDLKYSAEWHAIDTAPLSSNFSIKNTNKKTDKDNNEYYELDKSKENPIVRIGIDAFANNVQDAKFYNDLANNLTVLKGATPIKVNPTYDKDYKDIRFEIPGFTGDVAGEYTVIIKRPDTNWIKNSSINDDSFILKKGVASSGQDNKNTFLLEYLINGIRSGVNNSETIYMRDFKIVKNQQ